MQGQGQEVPDVAAPVTRASLPRRPGWKFGSAVLMVEPAKDRERGDAAGLVNRTTDGRLSRAAGPGLRGHSVL